MMGGTAESSTALSPPYQSEQIYPVVPSSERRLSALSRPAFARRMVSAAVSLPLAIYALLFFALFLTGADVWLGEERLLPLQPTVLLVAMVAPLLGVVILRALAGNAPRRTFTSLFVRNVRVITPFALTAMISLLLCLSPTANWQDNGIFTYIITYDFGVFLCGLTLPLLGFVRGTLFRCILTSLILLSLTILYDLVQPGFFSREVSRAAGFGGNANYAAILVVAMLSVSLRYDRVRLGDLLLLAFSGVTIFATLSRGGMILFLLVFVFYSHVAMVASKQSLKKRATFFFLAAFSACTVILIAQQLMSSSKMFDEYGARDRLALFSGQGRLYDADESRIALAREFLRLVDESPILGHGTGFTNFYDQGPHNMYLQQWVNNGIFGVVTYIWLLGASLLTFHSRRFVKGKAFVMVLIVASFFSHNIIDNRPLLLLLGSMLCVSLPRSPRNQNIYARLNFDRQALPGVGATTTIAIAFMVSIACDSLAFADSTLPVFPGAEGFGTTTVAGSGRGQDQGNTTVYTINSLADTGPGTLRQCVEAAGPRTCIFEVGGMLRVRSNFKIANPFLTIAGETAPSPGITIRGAGFQIVTHDVLIRHLRVRVGDRKEGPQPEVRRAFGVYGDFGGASNVVIDHCSMSWAIDENADTWYDNVHDVTFSNCIIAEALYDSIHPLGPQGTAMLVGKNTKNISLLKNLFAHNFSRNPHFKSGVTAEVINNVFYHWGDGKSGHPGSWTVSDLSDYDHANLESSYQFIGNVFKPGSGSYLGEPIFSSDGEDALKDGRLYVHDNLASTRTSDQEDDWKVVSGLSKDRFEAPSHIFPEHNVKILPARSTFDWVLKHSGARPWDRDEVDSRIIKETRDGTGSFVNCVSENRTPRCEENAGGWPPAIVKYRKLEVPASKARNANDYSALERWIFRKFEREAGASEAE